MKRFHSNDCCEKVNPFMVKRSSVCAGSSIQGVGTVHASSNFAASDYMRHR